MGNLKARLKKLERTGERDAVEIDGFEFELIEPGADVSEIGTGFRFIPCEKEQLPANDKQVSPLTIDTIK